jgi:hypothetical protein
MSIQTEFEAKFSVHRLGGEQPPHDLSLLLIHRAGLANRTGIDLDASEDWAPWLDTSYLGESDWENPDLRANIRAINDVCKLIDFVIADEDGNYLGYWRGPQHTPLSEAPIVCLDNEGQFEFCGTANVAGAVLAMSGQFGELRAWLIDLGVQSLPSDPYDLFDLEVEPSPGQIHKQLYEKYASEEVR